MTRSKLFLFLLVACAAANLVQPLHSDGRPPRTTTKCIVPGSIKPVACLAFSADSAGETYEHWTLDAVGDVEVTPIGDDDGDGLIAVPIVPNTGAGVTPGNSGYFWFFEPMSAAFFDAHAGLSADLPAFEKPDGTPLMVQYRESDFDFILGLPRIFSIGEVLSVSNGSAGGWSGGTILEMPAIFTPEELFSRDPSRFPPYTGNAVVADIALVHVIPEPATMALLIVCLGSLSQIRRERSVSRIGR